MAKPLIIGINGSPRKDGRTAKLLKRVLKAAEKRGAKVKIIHLAEKNIHPCAGHYSIKPSSCRYPCKIKDDMTEIYKLLIESDGIVFASPVYWFNVSGLMKNFLDRLTCLEGDYFCMKNPNDPNVFLLEGKVAGFVISGEEAGGISALNALMSFAQYNGLIIPPYTAVYNFGDPKRNVKWKPKDYDLAGENLLIAIKAQKYLEKSCPKKWPYPWDYKCKP
ncbi:flavodoxin family protein [Candidatus Woesearchaeota archaeon]|nr:flavodoxin family protein [Candidatus Woesearchaeota archaeon]